MLFLCPAFGKGLPTLCPAFGKGLPTLCPAFGKGLPTLCPAFGKGFPTLCPAFGKGLPTLCPAFGKGLPTLCPAFGKGLPTLCPTFGKGLPTLCENDFLRYAKTHGMQKTFPLTPGWFSCGTILWWGWMGCHILQSHIFCRTSCLQTITLMKHKKQQQIVRKPMLRKLS